MAEHSQLYDTAIARFTAMPSAAPTILYQVAIVVLSGRTINLFANGTSSVDDWLVTSSSIRPGATDPASVTPDCKYQMYHWTSNNSFWVALSTTTGDWMRLNTGDNDY